MVNDTGEQDLWVYEEKMLVAIAASLPIGYMADRKQRAVDIQHYPEHDMIMYVYDKETERYFTETYSKYTVSNLWDEALEEKHSVTYDPVANEQPLNSPSRVPKRASGCCDRADQY